MSIAIERLSAPEFYPEESRLPIEAPAEVLSIPSKWEVTRLFGMLMIAQYFEERGTFDGTMRVIGADEYGNAIESPNYKIDTMGITEQQKEVHNQMRRDGTFIKGVHDKRTKIGRFLAAFRIDEIPTAIIYPLAGVHKFYGNTRALLASELESPQFYTALERRGATKEQFLRNIRVGVVNVTQAFGVTELTTQDDFDTLVMSVLLDQNDTNYPSKTQMNIGTAKDIFSKIGREIRKVARRGK